MSMPFSSALWAANPGSLIEPTDVNGTWVVARVVEKLPAGTQPYEQAKDRVESELRREKGTELAQKAADEFLAKVREAGSLKAAADANERQVEESGVIARSGRYVPGIGGSDDLKAAIAGLSDEKKLADQTFTVAGDAVVVELLERTRPDDAKVTEQMDKTRDTLLARKQQQVFMGYIEELKAKTVVEVFPDRLAQVPEV
jgi:hypothetical protein